MKTAQGIEIIKWYCPYKTCAKMSANESDTILVEFKNGKKGDICEHCDREVIIDY